MGRASSVSTMLTPRLLFLCLILLLDGATAQSSCSAMECCEKKEVKGVSYSLAFESDEACLSHSCSNKCVYKKDGSENLFCFKGGSPSEINKNCTKKAPKPK